MDNKDKGCGFFSSIFKNIFVKKNSSKKQKNNTIKTIIVCCLILVIIIIFASSFKPVNTKKNEKISSQNLVYTSAMEYCLVMENRLINVLRGIKGISNINAFVMVEAGPTFTFLEEVKKDQNSNDTNQNNTYQTSVVLVKNGSVSKPVVVVEKLPKITGVLIVAKGATDLKTKTTLINVVSSVLNVELSRVEIMEGK